MTKETKGENKQKEEIENLKDKAQWNQIKVRKYI